MNRNEVAIVVGHDYLSKGAYSYFLGQSEYDYNNQVACITGCDTFNHKPNYSYKNKMKATYKNLSQYDLTLELHFNAASSLVQGVEALYFHTNMEGRRIAQLYCDMVAKEYGIRNRGAKPLSNENQRGYWAVASGIPTGLILEPFFGSNSECLPFKDKDRYARLLKEFVLMI